MAFKRMMLTMVLGLLSLVLVFGQNTTVKGQVKSNLGNYVADVEVVVAVDGDSIKVTTDLNGRFEIEVPSKDFWFLRRMAINVFQLLVEGRRN